MAVIAERFAGRRAIVTGASKGIGRATALRFAAEGGRVGLVARGQDGLEAVAAEIRTAGGECLVLPADCTVEVEVEAAYAAEVAAWGGLDVVVANAAIELPNDDARLDRIARGLEPGDHEQPERPVLDLQARPAPAPGQRWRHGRLHRLERRPSGDGH